MKIKELLKTVNVAWSPPDLYPILLAAGTAAQQLDASFNTSATLELYSLNLKQPGYDMELKTSVQSDHRFHKVIWGAYGNNPSGIIVGGCDYGTIKIYSVSKMIAGESDCILSSPDRHTGPVRTLDFNTFQSNLLASGATESEIFIWDIVNTKTPMTPGTRSQPAEDVQYIQWNKQVQHILASTFSQRCVIWDLRKNEPIIKLTDANSRIRWKVLQWHPEIATQLCLASEEDQTPIIQLWDLRFATSPLKTLQHHQRGVLSLAWSLHDPDLMLSCAKDNTIVCWNPNADDPGEQVLCELAQTNQWNFDVSWCPRSPGLIVGSSFDGHATLYSLLGGQQQSSASDTSASNKLVDSFPGMDPFAQPAPVAKETPAVALKKAPKWLKKPCGATFGFGGKLITFEREPKDADKTIFGRQIIVSQVITNPDMVQRSNELELTLNSQQFDDYCNGKADNSTDEHFKKIWSFIGAYFNDNVTTTFLDLLGYNTSAINDKLKRFVTSDDINTVTEGIDKLDSLQNGGFDGSAAFDAIAQVQKTSPSNAEVSSFKINASDDEDGLITQAILIGNIEAAVSLCFASKRYADAVILSMAGGPELLAKTQYKYFSEHTGALNSLINSLVSENWTDIVQNCDINCWKKALVGIFTHLNGSECSALCDILGDRLAASDNENLKKNAQICYICSGNLNKMIEISKTELQDTVELVMIMKKALELQGPSVTIDGSIAAVLSQYAESLASEGELKAALNYVGTGDDVRITMLRDRLYKALSTVQSNIQGSVPQHVQANVPQHVQNNQQHQSMQSIKSNYYNSTKPNMYQQSAPVNNWNINPLQNSSMGQPSLPPVQSLQPTPVNTYDPHQHQHQQPSMLQPQATQPPPPPSMGQTAGSNQGSRPSSVGPQSRPKYRPDPSIKSGPVYGYMSPQAGLNPMPNQSYQQFPSYGNYSNSIQNQAPHDDFKQPNIMIPSLPSNPAQGIPYDASNSQSNQQGFSNDAYQPAHQSSGWNDPPISKSNRPQPVLALYCKNEISAEHAGTRKWKARHSKIRNLQPSFDYQQPDPILHPLTRGPAQDCNNPIPESNYHQDQMGYNHPQYDYNHQMMNNDNNQYIKPFEPMQPIQSMPPIEVAKEVQPEKPKAPIPDQYQHFQRILDELKMQCYESARNPQMKRKIEDVSRKLEVLYDCLRDNALSESTLQGLDQISQMIQSGNYTSGLAIHTQLVSGPDFSQIASFMPGIKVLLQSALQLGVYIT